MYSFVYVPAIQGYDDATWATIEGTPTVFNNALHLNADACSTYLGVMRGEVTFRANVPSAPDANSAARIIGLNNFGTGQHAYFYWDSVTDVVFGKVNGQNATGVGPGGEIEWNTAWTATDIDYKIRWEGGIVRFFIDNTEVATYSASATANVPNLPLNIYASNLTTDDMQVKSISMVGIQSVFSPADAQGGTFVTQFSASVSENVGIADVKS